MEQLKYNRTEYLLRRALANPDDDTDYYCDRRGVVYCAGDGTPITFHFDLSAAYWNAEDLNRIGRATKYLRDKLEQYGYLVDPAIKMDWTCFDFGQKSEIDRLRRNVNALQQGFYSLPDWRPILYQAQADFEHANAIEWDLQCIDIWLERMIAAFIYSGELYSGEDWE